MEPKKHNAMCGNMEHFFFFILFLYGRLDLLSDYLNPIISMLNCIKLQFFQRDHTGHVFKYDTIKAKIETDHMRL